MTKVCNKDFPLSIKSNDLDFCNCTEILEYSKMNHAYGIYTDIAFIPIVFGELYDCYRGKFDIVIAAIKK